MCCVFSILLIYKGSIIPESPTGMTQNKYLACAYVLVTGCTLAWASQAMDYVHANDEPVAITVQIQPVNESDSLALVAFYEGSAGERWTRYPTLGNLSNRGMGR